MKKLTGCLAFLSLFLGLGQAVQARPAGGNDPTATADPVFAARETARRQLRPLGASLRLNERQLLAVEQLLVAEALAPGAVPARTQTLQLLYATAQLSDEQAAR